MKRHPALVPLSRDHHHGLVQAKRLRAGADGDDPRSAARTFLLFFAQETVGHFREEEELLFPLVADSEGARDPLARTLLEHQRIHALVRRLGEQVETGTPDAELMVELGELLEAHIRYEERQLFPLVERLVPDLRLPRAPGSVTAHGPVWGAESEDLDATVLEWRAGHRTPEHANDERDILIVVLAGSAEVAVGARTRTLREGEPLIVPKGEPHQIRAGSEGVRYLSAHRRRPPLQVSSSLSAPGHAIEPPPGESSG